MGSTVKCTLHNGLRTGGGKLVCDWRHSCDFNPIYCLQKGRKLKFPWNGLYIIYWEITNVAYIVRSEIGVYLAGVHVNQIQAFDEYFNETGDPLDGLFPKSERTVQSIIDVKRQRESVFSILRHSEKHPFGLTEKN